MTKRIKYIINCKEIGVPTNIYIIIVITVKCRIYLTTASGIKCDDATVAVRVGAGKVGFRVSVGEHRGSVHFYSLL